jgi:hypothetical protein
MRKIAALALILAALGGAAYFGSLRLNAHGNYPLCLEYQGDVLQRPPCGPATRSAWQLPVAVVIAALGALGAVGVVNQAKGKQGRSEG